MLESDHPPRDSCSLAGAGSLASYVAERLTWILVAIISATYFSGLTPGHVFVQDDFAAYVMHAANLVEGRPYTEIHYVPNPEAPWVSPANGYPPVYPLLLAPIYWQHGIDLRAMKIVTVATFGIFLATFAVWVKPLVSPVTRVMAVLLVGLNPVFWSYRDLISSEFPYLMFSFLALWALRRGTANLEVHEWRTSWAVLIGILLFASYGTRTIGIALSIAVLVADLLKFKRSSCFAMTVLALLAASMVLQSVVIISPKGYLSVAHISFGSILNNLYSYAKSLSRAWENGWSKNAEVVIAVVMSFIAVFGWKRRALRAASVDNLYVLIYLGILVAWGAQIGIRGLMPILPIYLTYVLVGAEEIVARFKQRAPARAFVAAMAILLTVTYVGALREPAWQASVANVLDPPAQQLFAFLQTNTEPSDPLLFSKPRSLALFTNRRTASLGPEESANHSTDFLARSRIRFVIQTPWSPPSYMRLTTNAEVFEEVFRNRDFQVYRVRQSDPTRSTE